MAVQTSVPLQLSATKVDFEALVLQLQIYLSQKGTWIDTLASGTGQTLIEQMAAVGTFNQFAIESAAREAYLETAVRGSSVYAITRMLGVRIARKLPAQVAVTLQRTGDVSFPSALPRFTEFTVGGTTFFNRDTIVFRSGSATATATLFEGQVVTQTFLANSQVFREIYLNEPNFVVSNTDVEVVVISPSTGQGNLWTPIDKGIWIANPTDTVYYDSTSGFGDTILAFGDGHHGALPPVGYNIVVRYARTSGSSGNVGTSGIAVACKTDATLTGITTSTITGGSDEKDPAFYKAVAPKLHLANDRAVSAPDYKAIISSLPSVASVTALFQRDIAPNDLRWMNVGQITILPLASDAFTDTEWNTFMLWFKDTYHAAIHIARKDPIKLAATVSVTLALVLSASAADAKVAVETNIRALFDKKLDTLGKRVAVSDIVEACKIVAGVDYVTVNLPTTDFVCPTTTHFYSLTSLTIATTYSERQFYNVPNFATS